MGMIIAAKGGYMEIIQLMIDKGANNWNKGLHVACKEGHLEIAKLMIDRGATNWNEMWNCLNF